MYCISSSMNMCLIYICMLMQVHFLLWPEMCTKGKRVVRWARCKRCIFRCTYYIQVDFNISRMSKFSGRLSLEISLKYFRVQNKRLRGSPRTWFACFSWQVYGLNGWGLRVSEVRVYHWFLLPCNQPNQDEYV